VLIISVDILRGLRGDKEVPGDDTFQDPDDVIDPDDSGPRLSVTLTETVDEIYALPAAQTEQTRGCHPDTGDQSKGPQSAAGTPTPYDLLDSRGATYDAAQSCRFYTVRAVRAASVSTTGDANPAGTQGDDRGLRAWVGD
jgi:hypothetical protein